MQCTVCWQQLNPGAVYCPSCQAATPAMGASFAEMERRLSQLQTKHRTGMLSESAYKAEVQRLVVIDKAGNKWWLGGGHGAWHWFNGRSWEPRDPAPVVLTGVQGLPADSPAQAYAPDGAPGGVASHTTSTSAPRRWWPFLLLGCLGLFLLAVIAGGVGGFLLMREDETIDETISEESGDIQLAEQAATLGPDNVDQLRAAMQEEIEDHRPQTLEMLGRPDAFSIMEMDVEGIKLTRESWQYFGLATQVDFVNGEAAFTTSLDPAPVEAIFPAWYDPLDFSAGMTAAEVIEAATAASPAGTVPEPVDIPAMSEEFPSGELLIGDQILIGLYDGLVVYVETVALYPEEETQ